MQRLRLPKKIAELLSEEEYRADTIGMSDSSVLLFPDKVLKIQETSKEAENEYQMLLWLQDKQIVPQVYACEQQDGRTYLLMSRLEGDMACAEKYMQNPNVLTAKLAKTLKSLWNFDISDCPGDWRLASKLKKASYNVEHQLVDMENVEPETFGENGFKNPEALLNWLYDNQPKEELVLSHGDFCLPNIFFKEQETGHIHTNRKSQWEFSLIDLGKSGIADKWCDIALCYRSLQHNFDGRFGKEYAAQPDEQLFFEQLGLSPDWDKIRYYMLLDELF